MPRASVKMALLFDDIQGETPTVDYSALWERAYQLLADQANSFTVRNVLNPLSLLGEKAGELRFLCKDPMHLAFCEKEKKTIEDALFRVSNRRLKAAFTVDLPSVDVPAPSQEAASFANQTHLNPRNSFENFVVGKGNEFAYSVCRSIVNPSLKQSSFNPLFLYSSSGLGKTHLIQAIGNYVQAHTPEKRVVYVPCEAFLNEFISNIQTKSFDSFRRKYRNCDYLLIDDIQFLQNKESTQEEFFHTFNALLENGSQIVLTCDKPPQQLNSMEDRLITRFRSGVMVDIQAPEYETRVAILKNMAEQNHLELSKDILAYIADNISSNVRELGGAFNKVLAYSTLSGEISLPITIEILKDMIHPQGNRTITPDLILNVVCAFYNVQKNDIMSSKRDKAIAYPRQVAMYFFRAIMDMTYVQISQYFNKKDHTTAKHNCDKIEELLRDKQAPETDEIEEVRKRISL